MAGQAAQRWMPGTRSARVVTVASVPWFGLILLLTAVEALSEGVALIPALIGAVALAAAHEAESGGRWLTGVALAAIPALLLLGGAVFAADGVGTSMVMVAAGALLSLVSLRLARTIARRFGDAVDDGGGYGYYG